MKYQKGDKVRVIVGNNRIGDVEVPGTVEKISGNYVIVQFQLYGEHRRRATYKGRTIKK